jgi:DNA-binding transcriptional MerR regulator
MAATFRISELAARSGFSPSALRYYERVGLLAAAARSPAGYRLYGDAELRRLRFIDRAKQLGLPLEEIRELVAVWDGDLCAHVQDRLREHITAKSAEVRARVAELSTFAAQLDQAYADLATLTREGPCGSGCGCGDPIAAGGAPRVVELGPTRRRPTARVRPDAAADAAPGDDAAARCTLSATDQPARLTAWAELLRRVHRREVIDGGLRLLFSPDPDLAGRIAELAALEQSCCAFLSFTLRPCPDAVVLDVQAPADQARLLTDLFGTPA